MKKIVFSLLFTVIATYSSLAQFSKTHYIPPISLASNLNIGRQYLYISTPSETPINVVIKEVGGSVFNATVSRDIPYEFDINANSSLDRFITRQSQVNTVQNSKGFIVEADDIIYITARVDSNDGNGVSNQAGALVSKGLAGLGTRFRIGGLLNLATTGYGTIHYTFVSIMATQNNTQVAFFDIKPGAVLINNAGAGNTPANIVLNAGETYVMAVQGPTAANRDALIGSSVVSDKPIVVNCGSVGGTNGPGNLDYGFDQIVSAERTGTEYIFIKSTGSNIAEDVHIIADEDNTEVYLNDNFSATPDAILNQGQYVHYNGSFFNGAGNLYIRTTKKVFAYQAVSNANVDDRNQELFFVPPLSCETPKSINNIPLINRIGNRTFTGRVTITTKVGSILDFIINGVNYSLLGLPAGITVVGPTAVTGNSVYECYTVTGFSGNIAVNSTTELYLAAYGSEAAATFGGYYSGFTFNPEVTFGRLDLTSASCLPNSILSVNTLSPFDTFQWYFNGTVIPGATTNSYTPALTAPGYYKVIAAIAGCGTPKESDNIPVSSCPLDSDNDGVNNNIDLDKDNDGLTNCSESFGNQNLDLTNLASGTITQSTYSNTFTGTTTLNVTGTPPPIPVTGDAAGNVTIEANTGKGNTVSYTQNYTQPISIKVTYGDVVNPQDLLNSDTEISIVCPVNRTMTILNADNQLLIDTNYDGIFESNVTQFSSFDIRFRVNGSNPLAAGTGTFSINGELISSLSISNKNLVDSNVSRTMLKIIATCLPKDSDGDGIPDQRDFDSDNDGILDYIESQGANFTALTGTDINTDGIDDAFGTGITAADTDNDGIPDYLDLDSDNDGIHDLDESGTGALDANSNGVIDGTNFGANGLANSLETAPDSGILNYTLADTDTDGLYNAIELDSDNDGCNDVIEAGYLDPNQDGLLGNVVPPTVNPANGIVNSGTGYGNPNANYTIGAPIAIVDQPVSVQVCQTLSASFTVNPTAADSYQWQISTDGGTTWTNLTNNANYSGTTAISMTVSNVSPATPNHQYRVVLNRIGNSCGLISNPATLTTFPLPVITTPINLVQCDVDTDGISAVNLTVRNSFISANYLTDTFTYFTTQAAAQTNNSALQINNPIAYTTASTTVWVRVVNTDGCPIVGRINVVVSATQISEATFQRSFARCDDDIAGVSTDFDGTAVFSFNSVTAEIQNLLPPPSSNYTITYHENLATAEAATFPIDPSNYRNTTPNVHPIFVRIDSTLDNQCYGLGNFVTLNVEALPVANNVNAQNIIRQCDDDQDGIFGFDTSGIQATIVNGQNNVNTLYTRGNGAQSTTLPNPLFVDTTETITVRLSNNTTQTGGIPCFDEMQFTFIVDDLPNVTPPTTVNTVACDDEDNPLDQDGILAFDTTNLESELLNGQPLTTFSIAYFDTNDVPLTDIDGNPIASPFPTTFETTTRTIRAVVTNLINTSCPATIDIPFIVNPTPKIDLREDVLICLPSTQTTVDAGILDGTPIADYTYQWFINDTPIAGAINQTLTLNTPGTYSVRVTNATNCFKTRVIEVVGSEAATLESIEISDLTDINTVLITVTGEGDYEYALDDVAGPYRSTNFFTNVPMGLHLVYVRDINGCGILGPLPIAVLGIPQFFTPNGDGYNDTWNVKGIDRNTNSNSIIYIFDRYGKLIKQVQAGSSGWDGTYNGNLMPADDYWYTIEFGDGRSAKGHFALKR
jgi:gliding motility-associated-like protein